MCKNVHILSIYIKPDTSYPATQQPIRPDIWYILYVSLNTYFHVSEVCVCVCVRVIVLAVSSERWV